MTNKQLPVALQAPDGGHYVCITDGVGNLQSFSSSGQIQGNATGTTGAVVGTLAAAAGKTTYISGFSISTVGSAGDVGPIVIAGLLGGSQTYHLFSTATGNNLLITFPTPLAASAVNTAITVTTTANATATAVDVNSWGYQQ